MWLPEPCLVFSLPLSLFPGWPQGAVDRFMGPNSLHTHVHLNSKLLIASSVISSIIVKNTPENPKATHQIFQKHLEYVKLFQGFSKALVRNLGQCHSHTSSPLADHSHGGYLLLNLQMSRAELWKLLETFKLLSIGRTLGIKSLWSTKWLVFSLRF